jgi:hypothetical protein
LIRPALELAIPVTVGELVNARFCGDVVDVVEAGIVQLKPKRYDSDVVEPIASPTMAGQSQSVLTI